MEAKRVVKGTAIGFLVAGPVGAAAGALFGSREKRAPKTKAAAKAEDVALAVLSVAALLGLAVWTTWRLMT